MRHQEWGAIAKVLISLDLIVESNAYILYRYDDTQILEANFKLTKNDQFE